MTSDKRIMKKLSSFKPLRLAVQVGLICGLAITGIGDSFAGPREQAKRMHDRLAGIPPTAEVLCAMEYWIDPARGNDPEQAAMIVMETGAVTDPNSSCNGGANIDNSLSKKAFYSVALKKFVTPWTNEEQTVLADLNDYTALVIGMIRDNVAFDGVLSVDLLYKGANGLANVASLQNDNNQHFADLQDQGYDLSDSSVLVQTTQSGQTGYLAVNPNNSSDVADPAGVVTTRAASLAFFTGGTNRLMWRATSMNYLCRDLEQMKDVSIPPDRIRQDVSRSPGGDSSIFLSACMGCHAGMDPLAGAYAYYDHEVLDDGTPTGRMLWKQNSAMFGGASATSSAAGVGEDLFNQNCASCHGPNAKSDNDAQNMINRITNAINNNTGNMGAINISAADISAIADFLVGQDQPAVVEVTEKHLINSGNFKYGYVTRNDQWTNYWRVGLNGELEWGWRESNGITRHPDVRDSSAKITTGSGAASMGYEVTSTKAFAQCQVEKVYKHVCLRDPVTAEGGDSGVVDTIANDFRSSNYNMKTVFSKVAAQCMGD